MVPDQPLSRQRHCNPVARATYHSILGETGNYMKRFDHRAFDAGRLAARKGGRQISVCLPARNEEATVGPIVTVIEHELMDAVPLVDEILVVDDGSTDGTADAAVAAGAKVVSADGVRPELGPGT